MHHFSRGRCCALALFIVLAGFGELARAEEVVSSGLGERIDKAIESHRADFFTRAYGGKPGM